MLPETILIIFALSVLFVAAIFDLKTREIPDTLSYGFIVGALVFRLFFGLSYFWYGFLGFGLAFILGYVLYQVKQMGGGDAKLMMGLGAAFGSFGLSFLFALALAILFIGGTYCLFWAMGIFIRERKRAVPQFKGLLRKNRVGHILTLSVAFLFFLIGFFVPSFLQVLFLLMIVGLIVVFYLLLFIHVVEEVGFVHCIPLSKVTEGDWLAKDVKIKNKILVSAKIPSVEKTHMLLLKKHHIRYVWVRIGVPFVPAYFLATAVTVLLFFI